MGETLHDVNGIQICAEVFGSDDGVPLLLVMGLGAQKVSWDPRFIDAIAARSFRVAVFDNRDVGRSTHFDHFEPDLVGTMTKAAAGEPVEVPYTLPDMATDAAHLLEALEMAPAHVMGASMGGMIVQQLVIDHPHLVRSVTSIMSTTGDPDVGMPAPSASAAMMAAPPTNEDEARASGRLADASWGSPAYPQPEAAEARALREFNRVRNPAGVTRQIMAIMSSPSRTEALGKVEVPFTVIHGSDDALVDRSGGARTAEAVPHAVHVEIEGMGHNLPEPLWDRIIDELEATVARAAH